MLILNDQPLDYWLLEIGLGGRLDAVNIVDPDVAVITSIALDHESWLGNTREAIGYEKAGICRPASPLICADNNPPHTVIDHVRSLGCSVKWWGRDFECIPTTSFESQDSYDLGRQPYTAHLSNGLRVPLNDLALPLPSVMAALEVCIQENTLPPVEQLPAILESAVLMGRMQAIQVKGTSVILDVAHNPAATALLASRLKGQENAPRTAVLGMMADKDIHATLLPLLGQIDQWFCVELPDNARAASAEQLAAVLQQQKVPVEHIHTANSVACAIDTYLSLSNSDKPLLIFGSFFTVADALTYTQNKSAQK